MSNGGNGHTGNGNGRTRRRRAGSTGPRSRPVLITGGAGFIGTNLAAGLLERGRRVRVFDNLARPGVERNLDWLVQTYGDRVDVEEADVRNAAAVHRAASEAAAVYHLAAQVAVTTSLDDPVDDFRVNVEGTLNVLEACRRRATPPPLLFTSTNKVYGELTDVRLKRESDRYVPADADTRAHGLGEDRPLDFHSPYGCSKGAADQYVRDYARCYGLPTVVFRMSCIYGPHQCGTEDQGWVAHFVRRVLEERSITLYGDGRQVRDLLFVDDLVRAMQTAIDHVGDVAGQAFNMGGGPANAVSLRNVLGRLAELHGTEPEIEHGDWRAGDQRYYVSDTRRFARATGWTPKIAADEGIARLYAWLAEHTVPAADTATV